MIACKGWVKYFGSADPTFLKSVGAPVILPAQHNHACKVHEISKIKSELVEGFCRSVSPIKQCPKFNDTALQVTLFDKLSPTPWPDFDSVTKLSLQETYYQQIKTTYQAPPGSTEYLFGIKDNLEDT